MTGHPTCGHRRRAKEHETRYLRSRKQKHKKQGFASEKHETQNKPDCFKGLLTIKIRPVVKATYYHMAK